MPRQPHHSLNHTNIMPHESVAMITMIYDINVSICEEVKDINSLDIYKFIGRYLHSSMSSAFV